MRKLVLLCLLIITFNFGASAQQFISISPDFGNKGQTISTTVTSSGFYFTSGSSPSPWGDFYMLQNTQTIYPDQVTVIDDDHLNVLWTIPANADSGKYEVIWDVAYPFGYFANVPGGFNIECVGPPAHITNSILTYCAGSTLDLYANTGPGFTYQWYNSIGSIVGAIDSVYTVSTPGYYRVKVSNAQGCPAFSEEKYVYNYSLPLATITPSATQFICQGNSTTLTANIGGYYTYQWFNNGNLLNGITTRIISVSDTGNYTVQVTNYYGCTQLSTPVNVAYASPPASWLTSSGPLQVCSGSSVTLKTATGPGYTYEWFKYGNLISGANNRTLVVNSTGKYKVRVTNGYGCTKTSGTKIVTVVSNPSAIISAAGPTSFCVGDSVILNSNTGSGYTYSWKKYGNAITGATASSLSAQSSGPYKVTVTNSYGCSKTSGATTVNVIVCREIEPNSISEIELFPNPATTEFYVTGSELQKVEIFDLQGKMVQMKEMTVSGTVDISNLSDGLYLVKIYTEKEIVTKQLLKNSK